MGLVSLVEQRKIGPTYGSESSFIPLSTPSGPQFTEAEMESELVEQLAFSPWVKDILTQPTIRYRSRGKERQYTADVLFEVAPGSDDAWRYWLIEVKPNRYVADFRTESAEKIAVAEAWCERHGAAFRIMTEDQIRTPHLHNVRSLSDDAKRVPDAAVLRLVRGHVGMHGASVAAAIAACRSAGIDAPTARATIEAAVARRLLHCDLLRSFDDSSLIVGDVDLARSKAHDPILELVQAAERA